VKGRAKVRMKMKGVKCSGKRRGKWSGKRSEKWGWKRAGRRDVSGICSGEADVKWSGNGEVLRFSVCSAPCRVQGAVRVKTTMQCIGCNVTKAEATVEVRKNDVAMSACCSYGASLRCSGRCERREVGQSRARRNVNCIHMARPRYATVPQSQTAPTRTATRHLIFAQVGSLATLPASQPSSLCLTNPLAIVSRSTPHPYAAIDILITELTCLTHGHHPAESMSYLIFMSDSQLFHIVYAEFMCISKIKAPSPMALCLVETLTIRCSPQIDT
jgi:hypothetical protein